MKDGIIQISIPVRMRYRPPKLPERECETSVPRPVSFRRTTSEAAPLVLRREDSDVGFRLHDADWWTPIDEAAFERECIFDGSRKHVNPARPRSRNHYDGSFFVETVDPARLVGILTDVERVEAAFAADHLVVDGVLHRRCNPVVASGAGGRLGVVADIDLSDGYGDLFHRHHQGSKSAKGLSGDEVLLPLDLGLPHCAGWTCGPVDRAVLQRNRAQLMPATARRLLFAATSVSGIVLEDLSDYDDYRICRSIVESCSDVSDYVGPSVEGFAATMEAFGRFLDRPSAADLVHPTLALAFASARPDLADPDPEWVDPASRPTCRLATSLVSLNWRAAAVDPRMDSDDALALEAMVP